MDIHISIESIVDNAERGREGGGERGRGRERERDVHINIHCDHTWIKKGQHYVFTLERCLHFQGTSSVSSKTLSGMSIQCWWNQVLHTSHSAISSPSSSGKRQESTDWVCLTPVLLRSPVTGKQERQQFSKQSAKCCLIDL